MQNHIIWKKSIYDRGFKCKCGAPLADKETGEPTKYFGMNPEQFNKQLPTDCYCAKCHELIATIKWNQDTHFDDKFPGHYEEVMENEIKKLRAEKLEELKKEAKEAAEKYYKNELETFKKIAKDYGDFAHKTKADAEKKLQTKDKQIQDLTKELDAAEAKLRQMEKLLNGRETDK